MASSGRGGTRLFQPPKPVSLIAVGLTVAFIALAYNYWTLTIIKRKLTGETIELQDTIANLKSSHDSCSTKLIEVETEKKRHEVSDKKNERALEDKIREMTDLQTLKDQLQKDLDTEKSVCGENLLKQLEDSEKKNQVLLSNSQQSWLKEKAALQAACVNSVNMTRQNCSQKLFSLQAQCTQKTDHLQALAQTLQKQLNENNLLVEQLQAQLESSIKLQQKLNETQKELKRQQFQQLDQEKAMQKLMRKLQSVEVTKVGQSVQQQELKQSETHIDSLKYGSRQGKESLRRVEEEELGQRQGDLQSNVLRDGQRVVVGKASIAREALSKDVLTLQQKNG